MRNYVRLGIDLTWVALSALLALLIRDNFVPSVAKASSHYSVCPDFCCVSRRRIHRGATAPDRVALYVSPRCAASHGRCYHRLAFGSLGVLCLQ